MKLFDRRIEAHAGSGEAEVRQRAVRGAGVTVFSGGVGMALQVIATVILARLLTPADFGVVAMVTTFSLLLVNFGLNGFTEAVVQREEVNEFLVSNLFWINTGAGIVLAGAFAAAGSLLARFFHDPLVTHVAEGISIGIFINSTSVLHLALLKRAMRFSAVSANDVVSRAVSVAVSIVFAWAGWGYWALVIGTIAQALSQSIGAWSLYRWLPSFPRRAAGTGSMVRFALHIYGSFSVNYFARNMDNLLVGWRFNAQALGFYKKAYDLFALSASQSVAPIAIVAVSALSRFKPDSDQFRRNLRNILSVMAFLGMALGADLTLVGRDVIRLMLGPGWDPAGRIFMFFGPGIGIMLVYCTNFWIHLSIGRPDRQLRWVTVEFCFTVFLFLLALHWGPVGIALAWTASFWLLTIPALWYAGRPIRFGIGAALDAIWKFVIASAIAGCATAEIIQGIPLAQGVSGSVAALIHLAESSVLFVASYLGAVIVLHKGFDPIHQVVRLVREMLFLRGASTRGATGAVLVDTPTMSPSE